LSDIQAKFRHHKWTLQQDGAPSVKKENVDFIKPDMWPQTALILNPMDYAVWDALQKRVYHRRKFKHGGRTKKAIITEWQRFIDSSINEWRRRLN